MFRDSFAGAARRKPWDKNKQIRLNINVIAFFSQAPAFSGHIFITSLKLIRISRNPEMYVVSTEFH